MENCVFAGTFDPVTVGHEYLIKECLKVYGKTFVVVGVNSNKTPFFSTEERAEFLRELFPQKEVTVVCYSDIKDYKKFLLDNGIKYYVRGIRNDVDMAYEKKMEEINLKLYPFIETVYLSAEKEYKEISSSLVKERLKNGQDIFGLVPKEIIKNVIKTAKNKGV